MPKSPSREFTFHLSDHAMVPIFFFILTETVYLNTGVCKYFYHPSRRKDLSPFTCLRVPAAGGSRGLTRMPWVGRELLSAGGI